MPRRRDFPEELAEGAVTSELFSAVDREKIREQARRWHAFTHELSPFHPQLNRE